MSTERPMIDSVLTDQTVLEESSAVFNCESRGTPPLSVTWFHNGVPLAVSNDDQFKRIDSECLMFACSSLRPQ